MAHVRKRYHTFTNSMCLVDDVQTTLKTSKRVYDYSVEARIPKITSSDFVGIIDLIKVDVRCLNENPLNE